MILTKEQREKFQELSKQMMKFLCDEFNPHVTVIIEPTTACILEGSAAITTQEFVRD